MPERLDFKAITEGVDIEAVAHHLGLTLSKDGRSECPACNSKDRALEIISETNTFRCWADPPPGKKCLGGDCIGLYAHVKGYQGMYRAAKELAEIFGIGGTVPSTSTSSTYRKNHATAPPAQQKAPEKAATKPPTKFDADDFGAQLQYDEQTGAIGLSEAVAKEHRIGTKRGKLYLPICPPGVTPAGYAQYHDGELHCPDKWLTNVVPLKRTA